MSDGRAEPGPPALGSVRHDPTWDRMEDQIAWYGNKAEAAQRCYKRAKVAELVIAAAVPPLAGLGSSAVLVSALASLVVILEGVQHLYQWNEQWIGYRSTCEALQRERSLYLAAAGPYAGAANPLPLLAERVEALLAQEHAQWTASRRQAREPVGTPAAVPPPPPPPSPPAPEGRP